MVCCLPPSLFASLSDLQPTHMKHASRTERRRWQSSCHAMTVQPPPPPPPQRSQFKQCIDDAQQQKQVGRSAGRHARMHVQSMPFGNAHSKGDPRVRKVLNGVLRHIREPGEKPVGPVVIWWARRRKKSDNNGTKHSTILGGEARHSGTVGQDHAEEEHNARTHARTHTHTRTHARQSLCKRTCLLSHPSYQTST